MTVSVYQETLRVDIAVAEGDALTGVAIKFVGDATAWVFEAKVWRPDGTAAATLSTVTTYDSETNQSTVTVSGGAGVVKGMYTWTLKRPASTKTWASGFYWVWS